VFSFSDGFGRKFGLAEASGQSESSSDVNYAHCDLLQPDFGLIALILVRVF
jgi:hypothetical protein